MQPVSTEPATGGSPVATTSPSTDPSMVTSGTTYASIVTKGNTTAHPSPRLCPVHLANRPSTFVGKIPAIILTSVEEEQLRKQRENTLIVKLSAGHPNLYEIRCYIALEWKLEMQPAVGEIDPRHITLHMASPADAKRALSRTSNKIKTSLFRLFRWTLDFEVGKDSSLAAVWVKLHNLPLHYFNEASLVKLGSLLGTVLRIHPALWR